MKAKIINLELLFSCDDSLDSWQIATIKKQQALDEIVPGYDTVIGLLLIDGFLYKSDLEFKTFVEELHAKCKACGISKLVLVPGMCQQLELGCEILFFDYNLNIVYNSYKHETVTTSNVNAEKFLFLTGIPSRPNRVRLTYKLWKAGLLAQANWSFFKPWTEYDGNICRNLMSDLTDKKYNTFINACERKIDNAYDNAKHYSHSKGSEFIANQITKTDFCKDPSWIDPSVFEQTAFSVISEGVTDPNLNTMFLSEKTWRTILNKHAFILAGTPEMYSYAKSLGLNMFEDFMSIKDYGSIKDTEEQLDAIVVNTKYFLKHKHKHRVAIEQAIEHNYVRMLELVDINCQVVTQLQNYGADAMLLDKYFNSKSHFTIMEIHRA